MNIYLNIATKMVVYPKVIEQHILKELPFMATENIMMQAVKNGGDRQELHEKIRIHSMAAARVVKEEGKENDLIERIVNDKSFNLDIDDIKAVLKPENFIGRAKEQTEEFLRDYVSPVLEKYKDVLGEEAELSV